MLRAKAMRKPSASAGVWLALVLHSGFHGTAREDPTLRISTIRLAAGAAAGLLALAAQAETQHWNYKSYLRTKTSGQYSKDHFRLSTISLEEKDGKAIFRIDVLQPRRPASATATRPAGVERSAETTIIVVKPPAGRPFRFIRNDGTGGMRYNLREDRWKPTAWTTTSPAK